MDQTARLNNGITNEADATVETKISGRTASTSQVPLSSQAAPGLLAGLDIGSTTVKLVALDTESGEVVHRAYQRHRARQAHSAAQLVSELGTRFPETPIRIALTGSGGASIARALDVPFIQEVVANAQALQQLYPQTRTAIELGGQDAKMLFFSKNEQTGKLETDDLRMNGTCAGGTGAFLDEIAALLNVPVEDFNALAQQGTRVYPVSGRCGVFAKTDMQPLINQGVAKSDLALSALHAIAKQTIGGLAQGRAITAPVAFEGGPLLFNPLLVDVFAERLGLEASDIIIPEHPETIVARGAALSLEGLLKEQACTVSCGQIEAGLLAYDRTATAEDRTPPLFASAAEREDFERRHAPAKAPSGPRSGLTRAYLGIDSGSTTTKIALVGTDGTLLDSFYAPNEGDPLTVAQAALGALNERWQDAGGQLEIIALGTTGYGEQLFAEAYHADRHVVETVAHARAALAEHPDASFVLDIGGQDMKALWLNQGSITDIIINEACSSGCGSFLEGFAASLGIAREDMASVAFASDSPADLGSRCTVFMESSVFTAQRSGKTPADIMAGLSRSIAENVLTKVIRSANIDRLGEHIVVQGGTFANDAVLRAFEERLGKNVTRSRYPELAGAIGAALLAADAIGPSGSDATSSFIGFDGVEALTFSREQNALCDRCENQCSRTLISFSSGSTYVTGNRCPLGGLVDRTRTGRSARKSVPNLFAERRKLLFAKYLDEPLLPANDITIGLPRVLAIWDDAPFWQTFFEALGFTVRVSRPSNRGRYEASLDSIASDTACFPAKLAHSHVRDLVDQGVDRIFMPVITAVTPEGDAIHSESMCALVKGTPFVIRSSDDPANQWDVPFDTPLFHWHSERDRARQLSAFMEETFGIDGRLTAKAIEQGDRAKAAFRDALQARGAEVISQVREDGGFAIVLAGRPYHNDPLVNHGLPDLITDQGIPVLTVDSLPVLDKIDLSRSRLDIVNNYHARMLRGALYAANTDCLEYAQIVSFGCGHDAYLSDEIVRLMAETSDKAPLVLKLDEGDVQGPLGIRVRSFVETVTKRHRDRAAQAEREARARTADSERPNSPASGRELSNSPKPNRELPDPYPVKFKAADRTQRTVLVPNTSHAFGRMMAAAFNKQGLNAVPLQIGREYASELGKRYVHNDICYPAQMVIGEVLEALKSGVYDPDTTAVGMAKYLGDCRLTHYSALLRKALDDAGFSQVPIITNDDKDEADIHPGFKMNILSALRIAFCLPMIDALESLLRKMRPYELKPGSADAAFEAALDRVIEGLEQNGARGAKRGFEQAIAIMDEVVYDRSIPRPQVLIVGEYLLNFHPGANRDIERYLEHNGMEVVQASMTDVIRKTYFYQRAQVREFGVQKPFGESAFLDIADRAFEKAHDTTDRIASAHPLYEPPCRMPELVKGSDEIVHHSFDAGEGVLIPAEVIHHYGRGMRDFIILQPFGCLPNHIVGRGIVKSIQKLCPDARILPLDYDPDVSFANIENRLQMLIMDSQVAEAERLVRKEERS